MTEAVDSLIESTNSIGKGGNFSQVYQKKRPWSTQAERFTEEELEEITDEIDINDYVGIKEELPQCEYFWKRNNAR